jgi:putative transcriptional regulator
MTLDEIKAARPRVDRAKVEETTEAEIARQMIEDGEDPQADPGTFVEDVQPARIRSQLGMSQTEFAAALTIPVATLRNWEQGRVSPDPAARALLRIVARDPKLAMAALNPARPRP